MRNVLQENSMQSKLDEVKAVKLWRTTVGDAIARLCRTPQVDNGVMTVGISNASLRHELTMNRTQIRSAINNTLGKEVINEIRFTT